MARTSKTTVNPMKKIIVIPLLAFAIMSAALNAYLGYKLTTVPQVVIPQDQTQQILSKVGALVELPSGVVPTIATVDDPEVLKKQGLFPQALKGDIILIYPTEKKAILYRPSSNKIIEISVVNITDTPPAEAPAPAPTPAPTPAPAPAPTPTPTTP